ncbi:MAG: hypothetical protein WCW16_01390 [Candidatus Magasanikbacteria bacterium]
MTEGQNNPPDILEIYIRDGLQTQCLLRGITFAPIRGKKPVSRGELTQAMEDTLGEIARAVVSGIREGLGREQIVNNLGKEFGRDVDIPETAFRAIRGIVDELLVARETAEKRRT